MNLRRLASRKRLDSFMQDIRRWGLARSLFQRLMAANESWLNISYAMERDLRKSTSPPTVDPRFSFRLLTQEELALACEDPRIEISAEFLRAALDRGDLCIGAFDGERLVAYTWRSFKETSHADDLFLSFEKPHRYGYKAFTLPEYRGLRLQECITPVSDQFCIDRGYTHGISFIQTHNYASLTMSLRVGSVPVGLLGYLRIFGRVFTFRSAGARRRGFGFHEAPRR